MGGRPPAGPIRPEQDVRFGSCNLEPVAAKSQKPTESLSALFERSRERLQRSLPTLLGLGLLAALTYLAVAGAESYARLEMLAGREAELEIDLEETRLRVERLRRKVELLHDDPVMLERLAREELGLVRPDEVVVVLPRFAE